MVCEHENHLVVKSFFSEISYTDDCNVCDNCRLKDLENVLNAVGIFLHMKNNY